MIYSLGSRTPQFRGDYFVADGAAVIGSVIFENNAAVWFGAVVRGDNEAIVIGENSNVQECSVLHTDPGCPLTIGRNVNNARIGRQCLIGANTLITEGKVIPDRSLVMGSPGKVIRTLTDEEIVRLQRSADHYVERFKLYQRELKRL
jgi:carbonic anhydrase/acetyltransferase-like protein (isoleucine patch superfamily)